MAGVSSGLEWDCKIHHVRCGRPWFRSVHRCLQKAWLWSILQRGVVLLQVETPPMPLRNHIYPMAGTFAAAMTWGHLWSQKRLCFHCDNQSTTLAWQGKSSKQPRLMLMMLLRKLFFIAAHNNFAVTIRSGIRHIPGIRNSIADTISRMHFQQFFSLVPQVSKDPTPTPGILITF